MQKNPLCCSFHSRNIQNLISFPCVQIYSGVSRNSDVFIHQNDGDEGLSNFKKWVKCHFSNIKIWFKNVLSKYCMYVVQIQAADKTTKQASPYRLVSISRGDHFKPVFSISGRFSVTPKVLLILPCIDMPTLKVSIDFLQ